MNLFLIFNFLFLPLFSHFVYHNIIQFTIKPDPSQIKNDLVILNDYKKKLIKENPLYTHDVADDGHEGTLFSDGFGISASESVHHFELYREIAKQLLEKHHNGIGGVCFYYRGFYKYSDKYGRVVFPRFDLHDTYHIIVTSTIEPVIFNGAIPDHFIVGFDAPYACYEAVKTMFQDGYQNEKNAWRIQSSNKPLVERQIPYDAIIIFGDPAQFFFSDIPAVAQESFNIILPPLFVGSASRAADVFADYGQLALNTLTYWKPLDFMKYETEFENQIHEAEVFKSAVS
jgi:hypothetical protein